MTDFDVPEPAELPQWLKAHGISTVDCCFVDLWGTLGARRLTAAQFVRVADRGLSMPRAPYLWSGNADIVDLPAASAGNGFPNLVMRADLTSVRLAPWLPGTGAVCFLDGDPVEDGVLLDTRAILRSAVAALESTGHSVRIASELEFYLLKPDGTAPHARHRPFSLTDAVVLEPVLGAIRERLLAAGVHVESSQTEYGPGQIEVNIAPSEPVRNADNAALLRAVARTTAAEHGWLATFMPMPVQDASGSGHHLHLSLVDSRGQAAFSVERGHELGATLGSFVAGTLLGAPPLTAVYLPTVNAYKRTADYTFAPNRCCWGFDNRSAALRIPPDRGDDTRIEFRIPSSDCNPYLVTAALLATGADGIRRGSVAPQALGGDAYQDDELPRLPGSLGEALDRMEESRTELHALPGFPAAAVLDALVAHGRRDLAAFAAHITDWEMARYLNS
jgi:glutamine synthetase